MHLLGPAVSGFAYGMLTPSLPALVPCLIGAALALTAALLVAVWLPESRQQEKHGVMNGGNAAQTLCSSSSQRDNALGVIASTTTPCGVHSDVALAAARTSMNHGDQRQPAAREPTAAGPQVGMNPASSVTAQQRAASPCMTDLGVAVLLNIPPPQTMSVWKLLSSEPLRSLALVRAGVGFANFANFEVVPLFAIASAGVGGLALKERELAKLLCAAAAISTLVNTFCTGRVVEIAGNLPNNRSGRD